MLQFIRLIISLYLMPWKITCFPFQNKFYIETKLNRDLKDDLIKLFTEHVAEKHIYSLMRKCFNLEGWRDTSRFSFLNQWALASEPQCWHLWNHITRSVKVSFYSETLRNWLEVYPVSWENQALNSAIIAGVILCLFCFPLTLGEILLILRSSFAHNFVTGNSRRIVLIFLK